jgi:hypothetical protein
MPVTSRELAKEHYFFEQQRKQELESTLNLPITVLTVLTGAVAYLIQDAYFPPRPLSFLLAALLGIAALGIVAGFAFTIKIFWRYYYSEVRLPEQLSHRESLVAYFTAIGKPELADTEFERDLANRYGEAVAQNAQVNQSRGLWLYRAKFSLSVSATAILLSAFPFAILKASEPSKQKECCNVERPECASHVSQPERTRSAGHDANYAQPGASRPRPGANIGPTGLPAEHPSPNLGRPERNEGS